MATSTKLAQEIVCYETNRAKLVEDHPNQYVLIKGDKIVGFFDSEGDAIRAGHEKFGVDPFLVRLCVESTAPVLFTSLYVGR